VTSAPRAGAGPHLRRLAVRVAAGLAGAVLFVALWAVAMQWLVAPGTILARFGPADAFATLGRLVAEGDLHGHVAASLRRIIAGLGLAAAIGIPTGLILGSAPVVARTSGLVLGTVRMISPLAWTPLAIILFGVGDAPVVFLIAIGALWPIVLSTSAGVAALDPTWLRVARSLGARRRETLVAVVWPGIRPNVLGGLRIATGLAWVILVPAEMLGVDSGLGYFILDSRDRFAYDELVAAIIVIGALGLLLDAFARVAFSERRRRGAGRSLAWRPFRSSGSPGTTAGARRAHVPSMAQEG
jgi:NitT/TauT family transport system permease protein